MRRTVLVRLAAIAALVASAFLTVDLANPGRGFCPIDKACSLARDSALGTIYGVPTSLVGLAAFGGLFLLTLLPPDRSRRILMPAGFLAIVGGCVFIAFQAYWLRSFCPLCLVADGAGILAGALALSWPRPPPFVWRGWLPSESGAARVVWIVIALLAVAVPMNLPRPAEKGWVEIVPVVDLDERWFPSFQTLAAQQGKLTPAENANADPAPVAPPPAFPTPTPMEATTAIVAPEGVLAVASPFVMPLESAPVAEEAPPAPETLPEDVPASTPPARPADEPTPAPASPGPRPLLVIEYVNAYCPHCRATHQRMERVARNMGVSVRYRRVYVWRGHKAPLWARACAYAQSVGREDPFFRELIKSRSSAKAEIYAAARRAGLNVAALQRAVLAGSMPPRLTRDKKIARATRINRLPTIDVGRRRLLGAQSEAELRVALQAATASLGPGNS